MRSCKKSDENAGLDQIDFASGGVRWLIYRRDQFVGDLIAGLVVAIMLVPQAMAYAMLAGLPPQVGLYASIVPLILYSLFGTSNALAVGPVAMVSLLVVSGVGELATPGSAEFIQLCLTLALMIGILQIAMAAFRLGFPRELYQPPGVWLVSPVLRRS